VPAKTTDAFASTSPRSKRDSLDVNQGDDNDFAHLGIDDAPPMQRTSESRSVEMTPRANVSQEVRDAVHSAIVDSSAEISDSMRRGVVAGVDDAIALVRVQLQNELNSSRPGADSSVLYAWLSMFLDPIKSALDKLVGTSSATANTLAAVPDRRPAAPVSPPSPRAPVPVYFVTWDRRDGLKPERERALQQADTDAKASASQPAAVVCWTQYPPSPADQTRLRAKFVALQLFFVSNEEMCGTSPTRTYSQGFYDLNEWLVSRGLPKLID
jgi:hypothetical protein